MPRARTNKTTQKTSTPNTITLTPDELQAIIQKAIKEAVQPAPVVKTSLDNGRGPRIGKNLFDTKNMSNLVPVDDNYTVDRTGNKVPLKTPGKKEKREPRLVEINCSVCRRLFQVSPIFTQKDKESGITYTCDACVASKR